MVNILYGLIAVPFLIGFYGKDEYGLITLAISINAYIALLDLGMTNSNVRFFSEFIAQKDCVKIQKLFNLTHLFYLVIGILNTILLVILSFFVDSFFKITTNQAIIMRNLIWILALNATFSWISICYDQFLRGNDLTDWIKQRATYLKLSLFILLIFSITFKWPVEWYFGGYTFMGTIILPLTIIKTRKVSPTLKLGFHFDKEILCTVLPYALSILSFSIFNFIVTASRPLFIGNLIGAGAVAEFNVLLTITSVVTVFTASLIQVLLPILTKLRVTNDNIGIQTVMMQGTKYVTAFLTLLILALTISAPEILTLYVGDEYANLAGWLALWLLTFLLSHRNVMTALVFTEKRLTSVSVMGVSAMLAAIICYTFLVPILGIGGIVIGWSFHELIHTLFYYMFFLPRRFKINTKQVFIKSVFPSWLFLGFAACTIYKVISGLALSIGQSVLIKTIAIFMICISIIWKVIFCEKDRIFVKSLLIKNK